MEMLCTVYCLGLIEYNDAYRLQAELVHRRISGEVRDTLLLLEHPAIITIGKSGKLENVLVSQKQLTDKGVSLVFVDRGGDVTYHGPGQLIGYPIINLKNRGGDLRQYVRDIEEVIIRTLSDFGIKACRDKSHPGVWVNNKEIAAIGLRLKKWVTMHGFALNVNTDLEKFSLINPCGFSDRGATSISSLLSQDISMAAVKKSLLSHFAEVFDARLEQGSDALIKSCL
jgi:lipoate-protein ligase B